MKIPLNITSLGIALVVLLTLTPVLSAVDGEKAAGEKQPGTTPSTQATAKPGTAEHMGYAHGMTGWPRHRTPRLTAEQETELLKHLEKNKPDEYKSLKEVKKKNTRSYHHMLKRLWRWYKTPEKVRKAQSDQYATRVKIKNISSRLKQTFDQKKRDNLIDHLSVEVARKFDADMTVQRHQLEVFAAKILKYKKAIQLRVKQRKKLIDVQVKDILNPSKREKKKVFQVDSKTAGTLKTQPAPTSDKPKPADTQKTTTPAHHHRSRHFKRRIPTKKQQAEVLKVLKTRLPELHERLIKTKKHNPDRYTFAIVNAWEFYQRFKVVPEEVADAMFTHYKSRINIWQLANATNDATDEKTKKELAQKLKASVTLAFDSDIVVRKHRLSQLEQQIKDIKDKLTFRRKNRKDVLEKQVQEIVDTSLPEAAPADDDEKNPATHTPKKG